MVVSKSFRSMLLASVPSWQSLENPHVKLLIREPRIESERDAIFGGDQAPW